MNVELKPCPFCGKDPNFTSVTDLKDNFDHGFTIWCGECGINMEDEYRDDVAGRWNSRGIDGSKVIVIGEETISALREGKEVGLTNGIFLIPASDLAPALTNTGPTASPIVIVTTDGGWRHPGIGDVGVPQGGEEE